MAQSNCQKGIHIFLKDKNGDLVCPACGARP